MHSLRSVSLGDQLADLLRLEIVRGRIAPGTHLVEDALAEKHGISRGPVRDALKLLTAEGLLESRRRGIYVKSFTDADIDELYAIREAAEQLSARLAITSSGPADWNTAQELAEDMREAAAADDRARYAKADLAFHTEYYVNSGSPRLLNLWEQYRPIFATLLAITNAQDSDLRPSASDHSVLLELTLKRDTDAFATELTRHLAGSQRRMHEALTVRDNGTHSAR